MSCYAYADIPELIEVFKAVKQHIWDGHGTEGENEDHFICHALEYVDGHDAHYVRTAKRIVELALRNSKVSCNTLEGYISGVNYEYYSKLGQPAIQKLRQQWVDKIIADLQAYYDGAK